MWKYILIIALFAAPSLAKAQDIKNLDYKEPISYKGGGQIDEQLVRQPDSLNLPAVSSTTGTPASFSPSYYPSYYWGFNDWNLHSGLNTSLNFGAMAQFGHHAYSGVGFNSDVAMMYAMPVSKRLSVAVGGYISRIDWGGYSYTDAGISGMVNYAINDKMNVCAYGQKSLTNPKVPFPMYDYGNAGDKFGAMFQYKPSSSVYLSVSIQSDRYNGSPFPMNNNYWYPNR